ncbi:hypothetical protein [Mucilaginibacter sp. dw_454]|uniref:PglD-related sugar-binding protein n=1 Tax=Mucilaginibacter sp. dw_454 TaxID=2720079 RepID=UPI001BD4C5E8|nr:hypothetical protein [Mucilaginibacter sp. dw_454]
MKDIAIFGAGGFGREVYRLIEKVNLEKKQWHVIGFFDDNPYVDFRESTVPLNYLGNIDDLNKYASELAIIVAVGAPEHLQKISNKIVNINITFPNIVASDVWFNNENLMLGKGNIIASGCIFTDNVSVGNFNVFNLNVSVGHDAKIGNYNVFNPNTAISGNVQIEDENFFGLGSSVIQNKKIGVGNKIGASTLIIRNIKNNEFYFGVPGYKSSL